MNLLRQSRLHHLLVITFFCISNSSCANETNNPSAASGATSEAIKNDTVIASGKTASSTDSNDATDNSASDGENMSPVAHGEQAHKDHCYKCHSDDVYTRDDHFVKSIDALSKQVVRCKEGSNIPWFDEDADAVVQFLNQKYYKF